jgi:diacylglycerol O-acyltransferase / wax synthase
VRRLTGLDAAFLYGETPSVHMHTMKIAIADAPRVGEGELLPRLRSVLSGRLHLLPAFRRRAIDVPFGLHHPVWVEDPALDVAAHVFHARLPAPGGAREMDDAIAEIASRPLRRDRPLWEVWVLEGLEGGRVAYVGKVHHALADGVASAEMLANVMRVRGEGIDDSSPAWTGEELPSRRRLLADGIADQPRRLSAIPSLLARTIRGAVSAAARYRSLEHPPPRPFDTPRTLFNRKVSAERSFATARLPLARLKKIKDGLDVTLNDVVLAIVGRAVSAFVEQREGPLDRSLVATVPVSVAERGGGAPRSTGNRLSNLFTSLCTDIDDPIVRLREIHRITSAAKSVHHELGPDVMQAWAEYALPAPFHWGTRLYAALRVSQLYRPPANVIVSSVRGPGLPLSIAGTRLHEVYSVGPILDGLGLNVTAWSYCDAMSFSVIADRQAIPDAHAITDRLAAALGEIEAAIARRERTSGGVAIEDDVVCLGRAVTG